MSITVLIVDDHDIFREGVKATLLDEESDFTIVGETWCGTEAVRLADELQPDVIIMDISMPVLNGIDATRLIKSVHQDIKVLILSVESDRNFIIDAIEAGASGYVPKEISHMELVPAIRAILTGNTYFDARISQLIIRDYLKRIPSRLPLTHDLLTHRERDMLQLIADGKNSKELADIFDISIKTVEVHRHNIMTKLDLYSIAELTKYAVREGLTSLT